MGYLKRTKSKVLLILSSLLLVTFLVACTKKPGNDLLNMRFSRVYVGGWMMETIDRQKPLSESDRLEITDILQMSAWNYQKDLSVNSLKPLLVLYDDLGSKVSVSEYQGNALIFYQGSSMRDREYYFAPAAILPLVLAFSARIEPDLVVGNNEQLPLELLNVWFLSAYVGNSSEATLDKWFELKQEDSLYIRAMLDMSRWVEAKDLASYAFESYYMLKGDGDWSLSVGVLAERALVSVINSTTGFSRKVYYAPISVLGEVEEVLRRISPVVEIEVNEFINVNLTRAYIGDAMSEWDGKWFDVSETHGSELRNMLRIEDWVIAHDLPAMGLEVLYSLASGDGINFWISPWNEGRALVGISVLENDVVRKEFYYAPESIIVEGQNLLTLIRPVEKYPVLSEALLNVVFDEVFTGVWADDPDDFVEQWSPLSVENSEALRFTLAFDSWILAQNLPPMGLAPQFMVRSSDGIRVFGTIFEGKSLIGVTNENVDEPGEYYFAPDWVVEFCFDFLNSLEN